MEVDCFFLAICRVDNLKTGIHNEHKLNIYIFILLCYSPFSQATFYINLISTLVSSCDLEAGTSDDWSTVLPLRVFSLSGAGNAL